MRQVLCPVLIGRDTELAAADAALDAAAAGHGGCLVITGEPGISGFAVDATNLYWATNDGAKSVLWKLPLTGGSKTKIGALDGTARHLLPAGQHVYFETGKQIWRSPT